MIEIGKQDQLAVQTVIRLLLGF